MFTVKATYRGETRKLSLDYTTSFPTYDDLASQLSRVFPINNNYYLSRLLFSPSAASPARILIATEIHSQDDYLNAVQPFSGRIFPNALLRFSVYDDTPHKQPSLRPSSNASPVPELDSLFFPPPPPPAQDRSSHSSDSDRRPTVPPKPAELFLPFEFISALSGPPAHSIRSSPHAPMDVDSTPQPQPQAQLPAQPIPRAAKKPAPDSTLSRSSSLSCCSNAEVKQEIRALISHFEKDVNKTLEKGFGSPAAPQVSIVLSEPTESTASSPRSTPRKPPAFDLGNLFADGAFPSNGPSRRCSRGACTRNSLKNSRSSSSFARSQTTGCLNASSAPQAGRPLPQVPEQVIHTHVLCDACNQTVVGVRHKCLDCPDFDLCSTCIEGGAVGKHNPFHEFFEIREPGRVIVHTVSSEGERGNSDTAAPEANPETPRLVPHAATCDLCESSIIGTRYKCCECPDFDTCTSCFKITPEQHPKHSFVKIEKPDDYVRTPVHRKAHFARCNSCSKTIWGVRYKCLHPECPDFDLCDRCEAMPIPVHPDTHPLLKMKTPDAVIPTVYRVGGTEVISPKAPAPSMPQPYSTHSGIFQPAPRDGYSPVYVKSHSPTGYDEHMHEDERAITPRPNQERLKDGEEMSALEPSGHHEDEDIDSRNPFADPLPMIAPMGNMAGSMASTIAAVVKGATASSPVVETEKSLLEGLLDRPAAREREGFQENKVEKQPSFVNDLEDFLRTVGTSLTTKDETNEVEMQEKEEPLSALVSGVSRLVALVAGEAQSPAPVDEKLSELTAEKVREQETTAIEEFCVEVVNDEEESKVATEEAVAQGEPKDTVKALVIKEEEAKEILAPVYSAGYISDVTVHDGQVFPPGAEFMKCWRMVNDGHVDWPESTEVVFVAGQTGLVAAGNECVKIGNVKVGEEVDVWTGELKAPEAPGRYVGYWRLRDGKTQEVFGNSIWVEIQVAETDHHLSDETSSMSGSSIVMMPTGLGTATGSTATSVGPPQSLTLTIPSSTTTSMDGESDIGSEGSLIDYISDGEVVAWEDARSRVDGASVASAGPVAPGSPLGDEFELVYDSSSDV